MLQKYWSSGAARMESRNDSSTFRLEKRLPVGALWKCSPDIRVFKIHYQTG